MRLPHLFLPLLTLLATVSHAQNAEPWRLVESTDQFRLQFSQLARLETLDGQFRSGRLGSSDQLLVVRSIAAGEVRRGTAALVFELLDSRQTLADEGSPLSSGIVNTANVQQLYANLRFSDLVQQGSTLDVKIGRQTFDLGSRRLIARSAYNTAPVSFNGVHSALSLDGGQRWQAFALRPVQSLPGDLGSLLDNRTERDRDNHAIRLFGALVEVPDLIAGVRSEFSVVRVIEKDTRALQGTDRRITTLGTRLYRPASAQQLDFDVEAMLQHGASRGSAAVSDVRDLDHRAKFLHAEVGYSFAAPWSPRLQLQFDQASGDEDPFDGSNERFDTLYGDRRFDFGPTSTFGTFARSNIMSAGYRVTATPRTGVRLMLAHRDFRLAEAKDVWVGSGLRDRGGNSGKRLGQQLEARLQWDVLPGNLTLESGFAWVDWSDFAERVGGAKMASQTHYFYLQSQLTF